MARTSLLPLLLAVLLLAAPAVRADEGVEVEDTDDYEDEERAFLLVHKSVEDETVVQGKNFTVRLDIYNVGQGTAKNIKINDAALPGEVALVYGSLSGEIKQIAPGDSASFEYSLVASSAGRFVAPPCAVSYQAESDPNDIQETVSSIIPITILSPSMRTLNTVLKAGSYLTLGTLNTVTEWRNAAIGCGVIGLLIGFNWAYTKITVSAADRRRQRALDELEGKRD